MARTGSGGSSWRTLFYLLLGLLILKALGLLKPIGIDPDGISFNIDFGFIITGALFGLLWDRLNKLTDKLSTLGERMASVEAKLSSS